MLETLRIQNIALIDEAEVEFKAGFNALTGETGAGKSILMGALNLVLGARASAEVLRAGTERASVEAVFRVGKRGRRLNALLREHEIALEDGALLLSRVVHADGRSKAYAGGVMVPVSVLAAIGDELVDLHGQHEHQSLLKADRQIDMLDAFAASEALAEQTAELVSQVRTVEKVIASLETDDRERARQLEFLRFEVAEIDAAGLAPGEEEEVRSRLNLITHAETIYTQAVAMYGLLYEGEDGPAIDRIDAALLQMEGLAGIDTQFRALADQLGEARAAVEAVAQEVRTFTERAEFDPRELEELNQRKTLIQTLKRKYGASVDEILAYREKAAGEIAAYDQRDERLDALRKQLAQTRAEALSIAEKLSAKRKSGAEKLSRQVSAALQDLGMKGAKFDTHFDAVELGSSGVDKIEFMLAANAGERAKPLRSVASGGEISRIMLALKVVFAGADAIPTLVFDEIDSGVGGAVARKVAEKIAQLARSHQVLCITHIAQIAAVAQAHFTVSKKTQKGRTSTSVGEVSEAGRVEEIARLLDGTLSEVSIEHARALLAERVA
jgi:DNA repair protein RecN (Recombination protein N)